MAVATVALPEFTIQDQRLFFVASEANNNIAAWPQTQNGATGSTISTYATATHTITAGPEVPVVGSGAQFNVVTVGYNGVLFFLAPNTPLLMPTPIYNILTASGSGYTVT